MAFVDARNNLYSKLQSDWFKKCHNLTHVFFGENKIDHIPFDLFNQSLNLRTVDFSHNRLKKIPVEFAEANKASVTNDFYITTKATNIIQAKFG